MVTIFNFSVVKVIKKEIVYFLPNDLVKGLWTGLHSKCYNLDPRNEVLCQHQFLVRGENTKSLGGGKIQGPLTNDVSWWKGVY